MKSERGMITLMTVFSGIAALMCLLVGLQLLSLETRIGSAAAGGQPDADNQFNRWRTEVHTGAVMSLGAGVLVFLFGLRNHATGRKAARERPTACDLDPAAIDPESLSVRIFEVDESDRSIEITQEEEPAEKSGADPVPIVWHPLDESDEGCDLDRVAPKDPAESILQSIQEAAPSGNGRSGASPAARTGRKSFLGRLFGR